jgi:hypothetical protein
VLTILVESPGTTLNLLKSASKAGRYGFKRKKLSVLGSYKEIKDGTKKLATGVSSFAQPSD